MKIKILVALVLSCLIFGYNVSFGYMPGYEKEIEIKAKNILKKVNNKVSVYKSLNNKEKKIISTYNDYYGYMI